MTYRMKTFELHRADISASIALDEATEAIHNFIVEKTDDYGECGLCGATMFYCMDYTHEESCPISVVERHYGLFTDALAVLDDALSKKMMEDGRGNELREHPLDTIDRLVQK